MNKLKVGILIDQLVAGGVQKTAILEARYLQKLGLQTQLLVLMRRGQDKNILRLTKGINVQFLSDRYPKPLSKSIKFPVFHFFSSLHLLSPLFVPFAIKQNEFDTIISHGTTTTFTALSLKLTKGIPYLFVIHDPMLFILEKVYANSPLKTFFAPLKSIAYFLEKILVKNSIKVVLDSPVHLNFIKKTYKANPQAIYLALDTNKKFKNPLGDNILTFGRWDKGKNLELLLKVVKSTPRSRLIIAGSWTNQLDLLSFKKLINEEGLAQRINVTGKYSDEELLQICRQARLWVHPNFEAFSLSALEAANLGLPIVIPVKSGITSLFKNKVHGFFPKKNSPSGLSLAIKILLNDKVLAQKMGRAAQIKAREVSDPIARAKKLLEIIKSPKEPKIAALEISHIGSIGTAGGDLLLVNMLKFAKSHLPLTLIVSKQNSTHWEKSGLKVKIIKIRSNPFEKYINPFFVFINYNLRIINSFLILRKTKWDLIYSSTDIIADSAAPYFIKILNPQTKWLARIHHLSQNPKTRPGNNFVNQVSIALQKISLKLIRAKANVIIVLNSHLKNQLVAYGFNPNKIEVLGGGVDFEYFSKFKTPAKQPFDAVYLGRLHAAKGIFDLPKIWQEVQKYKSGAKLAIIGPGDEKIKALLLKEFEEENLKNNVKFFGFINREQLASTLKSSKVFLFTDHEAGFGLAAAEAMASGLPIVGYDIGILGNVFKSGYLKVPAFDIKAFAKKVTLLLNNKNLRIKLAKQAKEEAAKHDWSKSSKKFEILLYRMLKKQ